MLFYKNECYDTTSAADWPPSNLQRSESAECLQINPFIPNAPPCFVHASPAPPPPHDWQPASTPSRFPAPCPACPSLQRPPRWVSTAAAPPEMNTVVYAMTEGILVKSWMIRFRCVVDWVDYGRPCWPPATGDSGYMMNLRVRKMVIWKGLYVVVSREPDYRQWMEESHRHLGTTR